MRQPRHRVAVRMLLPSIEQHRSAGRRSRTYSSDTSPMLLWRHSISTSSGLRRLRSAQRSELRVASWVRAWSFARSAVCAADFKKLLEMRVEGGWITAETTAN